MRLWNFYVNDVDKYNFRQKLTDQGFSRQESATLRALMELYSNGSIPFESINPLIEKHTIIKNNRMTKL